MKAALFSVVRLVAALTLLVCATTSGLAAATLSQQIDPPEANVGDQVIVTFTVQNGSIGNTHLPTVDGLQLAGTSTATNITMDNGSFSSAVSLNFALIPSRPGDYTIPAFDIHLRDGGTLRTQAMKLHVLGSGNAPPASTLAPANPPANAPSLPAFNPNGPVVMPPNASPSPAPDAENAANANVPKDPDGRPAKVFVVITPQTTDAYVGQSIPMRIEWYLRLDVDAQQDSLPTIKGSDFLMNNLSVRPQEEEVTIMDEQYRRESWITAISAPKSGDFPLQMERDTYWVKGTRTTGLGPFGSLFFSHPDLAHESIGSNQLTIHVHSLPEEGRPANFTGAIGQFSVEGSAAPLAVAVGEPVTLRFTVSGEGNFDYVRCPTLANDPAWKSYVASSKIEYRDQSHTQGVKMFEQAVIPQKNGTLPLPQASFSSFDPSTKQYVTTPITLPAVTVTGSAVATATVAPVTGADSTSPAAAQASEFLPNRLDAGSPHLSLTPIYRQTWFWAVQGGLIFALALGTLFTCLRSRANRNDDRAERLQRQHSLRQEEDAMGEAVRRGDAVAFFTAARHALQLQLGTQWRLKPEAITLGEIRRRDPQLAGTLEPFFTQADEVIYSGHAGDNLDLAQWERHARELLQPQSQLA